MDLLDRSPAKKFIFSKKGLTFILSVILGSVLTVLILLNFLPFGKDIFNQLFPKPPAEAILEFPDTYVEPPYYFAGVGGGTQVNAVVDTGNTVYIGGNFHNVGIDTGPGVPINVTTGLPVTPYPRISLGFGDLRPPSIYIVIPDGSNGWYVGGQFNKIGVGSSTPYNNLVHILPMELWTHHLTPVRIMPSVPSSYRLISQRYMLVVSLRPWEDNQETVLQLLILQPEV